MIAYDLAHSPPAPVVEIEVLNPYKGKSRRLRGKIDTGADISAIPTELYDGLELKWSGLVKVHGFNEERSTEFRTCRVNLSLENHRFELVEVVCVPKPYVLVGRDILNQLKILLDGRNLQFQFIE
jgi:hypothetical protein